MSSSASDRAPASGRPEDESGTSPSARTGDEANGGGIVSSLPALEGRSEEALDRLTRLAASLFDAPAALLALATGDQLTIPSSVGLAPHASAPLVPFLEATIEAREPVVVRDASQDRRYADHPVVTGAQGLLEGGGGVRFWAGAPLVVDGEACLGVLGVLAPAPRSLSEEEVGRLEDLAETGVDELALGWERKANHREERKLLESIFNTSAAAITVLNTDGEIVRANARAEEVLGLEPGAVEGRTYDDPRWEHEAVEGGPFPAEKHPFRQVMSTEAPVYDVQHAITWPDGRRRILSVDGAPLRDESDEIAGAVFLIDDITERKEMEEQLREREERFRSITQNISDGIYRSDPDEGIIYANKAFVQMFGYESLEEVQAVDSVDLYSTPEERDVLVQVEREQGSIDGVEVEFERKDGSTFIGLLSSRAVRDESGEVRYYDGVITDITERKKYEEELAYHSELERIIVGISTRFINTPIDDLDAAIEEALGAVGSFVDADRSYVFLVDEDARTTSNTHEWCDEGIAPHQPTLQHVPYSAMPWFMEKMHRHEPMVTPWVPNLPEEASALRAILEDGNIQSLVVLPMTRGDTLIGFVGFDAVREQRSWDPETVTILRVLGDAISSALHRKEMEKTLREAKDEAEKASVLKSAMLANMSHEIRTPLTSIIGLSEVLEENLEGEHAELAEIVYKSSQRLKETLTSVLQLSKLESGGHDLSDEQADLAPVVEETVELLQPKAHEQSVRIETVLPEDGVGGTWDEGALKRIVTNLVENAIKFTPEGGAVEVEVRGDGQEARLRVEDTGVGIEEDFLPSIFNAFEQEKSGIDREHEGSGLGLAITKRLTEALGGEIDVASEKGVGTRFVVRLPRSREEAAEE